VHVVGDVKKHMSRWPGKMTRQLEVRSDVVEFSNFVGFSERSGHGVFFCTLFYLTIFREEFFEDPGQLQYRISAKKARKMEGAGGVLCCCD